MSPMPSRSGYDVTNLPQGCPGGDAAERAKHKRHGGETPRGTTPVSQQAYNTDESQTTPKASQRTFGQGTGPGGMPIDPAMFVGNSGQGPQNFDEGTSQSISRGPASNAYQNPSVDSFMGTDRYFAQDASLRPFPDMAGQNYNTRQLFGGPSDPMANTGMYYGYQGMMNNVSNPSAMGSQNVGNTSINPHMLLTGSMGQTQMPTNMFSTLDRNDYGQSQPQASKSAKDFKTAQQYAAYVTGRPVPETPPPPPGRGKKTGDLYIEEPKDGESSSTQRKLPFVRSCAPINKRKAAQASQTSSGGPSSQGPGTSSQGHSRGQNQLISQPQGSRGNGGNQPHQSVLQPQPQPYQSFQTNQGFPPQMNPQMNSHFGPQNQFNGSQGFGNPMGFATGGLPNPGYADAAGQYGSSGFSNFSNFGNTGTFPGQGFQQSAPGFAPPQALQNQGFGPTQPMPHGMTAYSSTPAPNAERSAQIAREFQALGQEYRMQRPRSTRTGQQGGMQRPIPGRTQRREGQSAQRDPSQLAPQTRISAQEVDDVVFESQGTNQGPDEEMKDA